MRGLLALPLLLVVLAGCTEAPAPAPSEQGLVVDPDRPVETFGEVVTGPAVGPDLTTSTAAPPRLVEGEWWRVRFSGEGVLAREDIEVVRVVANATPEGYVMGMPHEGWLKEAIAFHSPAFGDVGLDLSYDTHNERFTPVKFPLVEGATWETSFALTPCVATVTSADEYTAVIELRAPDSGDPQPTDVILGALGLGGGCAMTLTYDARLHEIVKMESFIGLWEVVEHGYGFEGWVTVPRGEHTAIDYGALGPVSPSHTPMARTVTVQGGFNRMTMMHLIAPIGPGQYRIRDVTPDGTEFLTEASTAFVLKFYEATDPDGEWTVEDVVLGAGATYSMGIAYHQYDIRLPDGLRRADHSHEVIR